ncbi:MAG: class I SAM-dependent methyltransferase [Nanoarchaeota archaeon]|nr:class I SAM-dependent methyltransferase [Nanoarchaeota archaeon]
MLVLVTENNLRESHKNERTSVKEHFENIALDYDKYKERNRYYYQSLKRLLNELVPDSDESTILEIGCGTGSLLDYLNPRRGVGTDISKNMIGIARKKHRHKKNLSFEVSEAENITIKEKFDFIILIDLIEHLGNPNSAISELRKVSKKETRIIISHANPIWEPILNLLEWLKLKMPEGPHNRITQKELEKILTKNNFKIIERGYRLLLPVNIPLLSNIINSTFYRLPLIKKSGLIQYEVIVKRDTIIT